MMLLLRILGGWSILAGVIALVWDVTDSYQNGTKLAFAALGKDWHAISPASLVQLQAGIEQHVAPVLWDPVILAVLKAPAFAVFVFFGVLLYLAGLRRRKLNIYAN